MICHRGGKGSKAFKISSSWYEMKNGVECGSWIGAKEVVKSYKPVHISNIASKLLTGQGLINGGRVQRFLLHFPYSSQEWWTVLRVTRLERELLTLSENVLIPAQKWERGECMRVSEGGWRGPRGLLRFKNLICILRSEGSESGSYTDSSESQSGLCILLPLAQWRMRMRRRRGISALMRSLYSRQDLQLGTHPSPHDQWVD